MTFSHLDNLRPEALDEETKLPTTAPPTFIEEVCQTALDLTQPGLGMFPRENHHRNSLHVLSSESS
jgi:hypothetical protein